MPGFSILYDLQDKRIIPFLLQNKRASVYHHPAWLKGIQMTFNHRAFYLIEEDENNNIIGLIPFVNINSVFTGNRLVSLPFSTYCDPLISEKKIPSAINFLQSKSGSKIKIDFRTLSSLNSSLNNFSSKSEYTTHILKLGDSEQSTFDSFHPTSVRASIRRADKNKLEFIIQNDEQGLKVFYALEVKLRKRLALPPLPFSFYKNVFDELNKFGLISIPIIKKQDLIIAAGFIIKFKDTVYLEYTASDRDYKNFYPNHKLFWEIIRTAQAQNVSYVDFGRTAIDNEPLIVFKEKWNAQRHNIWHSIYPDPGFIKEKNKNLRSFLTIINKYLPETLLKIQGSILYPHLD